MAVENSFFVVASEVCVQYEEKNSKFLGYTKYVRTEEDVNAFLKLVKQAHPKATHICYAYILGQKADISKNNDDGEPAGTAGVPILDAIKKRFLTNTLVVVVRYFGGKELGTNGLYKAYNYTSIQALIKASYFVMTECSVYELRLNYNDFSKVGAYLRDNGYQILNQEYTDVVKVQTIFPVHKEQMIFAEIKTLLGGNFMNNKVRNAYFRFNPPVKDKRLK